MKIFEWLDGWRDSIVNPLSKPIEAVQGWFSEKLADGLILMMERVEPESLEIVKDASKTIVENPDVPPELKKMFQSFLGKKAPAHFALAPLVLSVLAIPVAMAAFSPAMRLVEQQSMKRVVPSLLTPFEAVSAYRRGIRTREWLDEELSLAGYSQQRQDAIYGLSEYTPQPQDLVRFAVRDSFNEEIVKKYQYDRDFPQNVMPWAAKIGVSTEVMKLYWRSHWELPSPTQMYEMLHREKITMEDARTLLRIADIAPAFVEPMLAISYNPYTRVDIRRMWDAGVLKREEVKRAYKDGGYDEEHAEKLTAWTVAEGMKEEADLTKGEIKSALVAGEITEGEAEEAFKKLGYDDRESKIIVSLALYSQEKALKNREKNILVKQYAKNLITLTALETGLNTLKMSEREKKITIAEAKLQVKEKDVV